MYGKGKGSGVPSDGQAREKLALYVYEYLLHVGAQKSAQTFLSESAAAAPSPVMGNLPPGDGMPGGPMPPAFFQPFMSPRYPGGPRPPLRMPNQPPVGVPGSQPLLPSAMDPAARPQGHPGMGGPMQRMNPPRGMAGMAPQTFGSGMRPPPSSLPGPGMPAMNMGPGGRGPWPNPNANSIAYSSSSPGNYVGPPGGGGPPGTPILPSPGDSTNSSENMYTMMNPIGPGGSRPNFPMGPGSEGPMGGMSAMEPHHMNGSLGSGDMDGLPKSSPSNLGALSNPPGTPRDEAELSSSFLNPFQSDSYSPSMTMSV
ncbi:single-stranded DNA-binding protein 4 isoform X18 [Indicator indicator]|uniref:single-stranded DNA-binding protein 4 isoform X18 n=1 Tax=Indicator indicator TaxID=1002788 RepID=UPI0023DF910F|nr:single-stranded DNA-binding protein 4 isoform X18 [Indicator indicator]